MYVYVELYADNFSSFIYSAAAYIFATVHSDCKL